MTSALVAFYLVGPTPSKAIKAEESADMTKFLADVKTKARELRTDSENMEAFTRSAASSTSYVAQLDMIRGHVNKAGKRLSDKLGLGG